MIIRNENFPGSTLSSAWSVIRGTFAVNDGIISVTANGSATAAPKNLCLLGDRVYHDVEVSMKIGPTYDNSQHLGGPIIRATVVGSVVTKALRMVWKPVQSTPELSQLMVTPIVDDNETGANLLDPSGEGDLTLNIPFLAGDVMTLRGVGDQISAYKNGVLIRTVTDTSATPPGRVGFFVVNTTSVCRMSLWRARLLGASRSRSRSVARGGGGTWAF